jgi:FkbM family methyltransferase
MRSMLYAIANVFQLTGDFLRRVSRALIRKANHSKLIKEGIERSLYRTRFNDYYWLKKNGIDKFIVEYGIFEEDSTRIVKKLVHAGDIVIDVGANIGYYSVIFGKRAGSDGRVLCFEPTQHFGSVLQQNIEANSLVNCEVFPFGLSNKEQSLTIHIDELSATLHPPANTRTDMQETVQLVPLDIFVAGHPLPHIDFIKLDVDGHEPFFFEGAIATLRRFDPVVLLETSHLHYLQAGFTMWDFYDYLKKESYHIYFEKDFHEILSQEEFLSKCGNFDNSANIIIARKKISC